MVIGVTGGIGSGKTTIVKMFAKFDNVVVYYADEEAKKLMNTSKEIREKLQEVFSDEVYVDNKLNRPFLANIVFKDKKKLALLNSIVHPVVYKHLNDFITNNQDKTYILYENAILFENGSDAFCDKIIAVVAPLDVKLDRVVKRDATTKEEVLRRMNNKWADDKKTLQSNYVINNHMLRESELKVLNIHNKLTKNQFLL